MKFEWKIFPGFTTLGSLEETQIFVSDLQCESVQFTSSCQCTTTLTGKDKENEKIVLRILFDVVDCA